MNLGYCFIEEIGLVVYSGGYDLLQWSRLKPNGGYFEILFIRESMSD